MTVAPEFMVALLAMAAASFAVRAGGFLLMRFVPVTPRLEAALKAIPIGVMVGIVAPVVVSGRLPELAGLAVVGAVLRVTGSDVVAALAGVATVALMRLFA